MPHVNPHIFIGTLLVAICSTASAQRLSERELKEVRGATVSSCFKTQRAQPINSIFDDKTIRNHCSCQANIIFNESLTVEELHTSIKIQQTRGVEFMLNYLLKGKDPNDVAVECANKAMGK